MLTNSDVHQKFRDFCLQGIEHGAAVGRYVIMPDHIHLFISIQPATIQLTRWVQALKSVVGKALLRMGHSKPHWQEGFFDHLLRSGESYSEKWEYVRLNPVRAGLVEIAEKWPYQGEIETLRF